MKTKRILITLPLNYGLNEMVFESSLTRKQISISNPELTELSICEFCMLSRERLLAVKGMTPETVAAIEHLLTEYSLRFGMSGEELEAYLKQYYEENPREKEFYDLCDKMCNEIPVFDEKNFREKLGRELNGNPLGGNKLNDLGWQRYHTVREAYLRQPLFLRLFGSRKARIRKAIEDASVIHDMFCRLVTESCINTERWYFEHREMERTKE